MKLNKVLILLIQLGLLLAVYGQIEVRPLAVGHRGFDSIYPENTLEGFYAACYLGADYVELDIQVTVDRYLVVSHDAYLSRESDIADHPEFADRKREFDNKTDWWIFDFTFAELETLRVNQGLFTNIRPSILNGRFKFPLLDSLIQQQLAFNLKYQGSRNPDGNLCGLIIESKDPQYYRDMWGIEQGKWIVDLLAEYHLDIKSNSSNYLPIILHSFDAPTVQLWHNITNLINSQLFDHTDQPYPLEVIATYAQCIGVRISDLYNGTSAQSSGIAEKAHQLGMCVHGWIFQDDNLTIGKTNLQQYWVGQKILKLDAFHTEFPGEAVNIIQLFKNLNVFPGSEYQILSADSTTTTTFTEEPIQIQIQEMKKI